MLLRRIGSRIKRVLEQTQQPPKMFIPDPDRDVFLVSYPRSGNTWLRAMIAQLLMKKPATSLHELDYIIPDIHYKVPLAEVPPLPFYVVKSHEPLRFGTSSEKYRKVIYIVRDPRDVAMSYHRYMINNGMQDTGLEQFVQDFARGRIFPGSWQDHVESWTGAGREKGAMEMLVLKYEDIQQLPASKLTDIARFLGAMVEPAEADEIASQCSKNQMIIKEKAGNRPMIESGNQYFIGTTLNDGWAAKMSDKSAEEIKHLAGLTMQRHGYL